MFLFKKIVAPLFFPMTLCLLLIAAGLVLLWFSRRQRTGKVFVTLGFAVLTALSYASLTRSTLVDLERHYPPLVTLPADSGIRWIVVLGGGASPDPGIPPMARLSEASLARVVEGVRLHRQAPGSRLLLSGGGDGFEVTAMRALAEALGVAPEHTAIDRASQDTETQARNVKTMIQSERCVLVTSGSHMRRSIGLFRSAGVDALAAPTHYTAQRGPLQPGDFFPGSHGLSFAERITYEYLGMAWAMLRGIM
jgi:uncharacterized SAM-binding protein YcdF (DUF218 family)